MLFYITQTQEPSKMMIDNVNEEIKKTFKTDKTTSTDMIKLPYNKGGLDLCDIRTKSEMVNRTLECTNR